MITLKVVILIPPFYDKDYSPGVAEEVKATEVTITSIETQEVQIVPGDVAGAGVQCDGGFTLIEAEWKGKSAEPKVIRLTEETTIEIKMPKEAIDPKTPHFYGHLTDADGKPQIGSILIWPGNAIFATDEHGYYETDPLTPGEWYQMRAIRDCEFFVGGGHGPFHDGWVPHTHTENKGRVHIGSSRREVNHKFKPWPVVTLKLGDIRPPRSS